MYSSRLDLQLCTLEYTLEYLLHHCHENMMNACELDSCRGTVPMEPPMSNGSMHHREPESEIDDTGHFLQRASYTIAAIRYDARRAAIKKLFFSRMLY